MLMIEVTYYRRKGSRTFAAVLFCLYSKKMRIFAFKF